MKTLPLLFAFSFLTMPTAAFAAISLRIDTNEPENASGELPLTLGQEFDADVVVVLSEPADSLQAYSFRIRYDIGELLLLSNEPVLPAGWTQLADNQNRSGNDDVILGLGTPFQEVQVGAIDFRFSQVPLAAPSETDVARLRFRVLDTIADDIDVTVDFIAALDGFTLASGGSVDLSDPAQFDSNTPTLRVSAVPEPGSLLLVVASGTALAIRRRR